MNRASARCAICILCVSAAVAAQDLGEALVVTATRTPETNAPSKVTVIEGAAIRDSKALDEALRADPSFSLFRRNSSLVADPSSQGVTLRGLGPSGVSRALVLEDGVPLNDGFGGWVYWGAVPRLGIARVEIAPGASSALFGSSAMGGVVEIVSRAIVDHAEVELQGGSFGTGEAALSLGKRGDTLAASLDLEGLGTGGYQVVASPGLVDHAASSRRVSGRARVEARLAPEVSAFVRVGGFGESEDGGTRYTTASAHEAEVVAGVTAGSFDLKAFARQARFDQDRARLLPDAFARASEQLASSQAAPADDEGLSLQYASGGLVAGLDARRVFGRSQEALHPAALSAGAVLARNASGEQQQGGIFVEEVVSPLGWLRLQGALRFDLWRNLGGIRHEQLGSGALRDTDLPDRSDRSLTPRLAARAQALSWLAFRGAVYRAFRAPTLNELYRPFQVGPVRTEANPLLGPETSWGGEAGVDLGSFVRATGFWSTLEHPITNVTTGPNQQQRENLGAARIRGLEVQATWSLGALRLEAGWTLVDARVTSSDLQGRALPQDPRHRLSGSASWTQGGFFAQAGARFISEQFEDDRNQLRLPGYAVVDLTVAQQLPASVTLFASLENLLDRRYLSGLQGGVANLGQPFCARIGARFKAF